MRGIRLLLMIVGALATVGLLAPAARDGLSFRSEVASLMPLQLTALVAMTWVAALLILSFALSALQTGVVEQQRPLGGGVQVTRSETPVQFWIHVVSLITVGVAFVWLGIHVIGSALGWWSWSIEF